MPYIKQFVRNELLNRSPNTTGELNYEITKLINDFVVSEGKSYQTMNDVVGALESAKLEFYRRVVVPYENTKLSINGDVYT